MGRTRDTPQTRDADTFRCTRVTRAAHVPTVGKTKTHANNVAAEARSLSTQGVADGRHPLGVNNLATDTWTQQHLSFRMERRRGRNTKHREADQTKDAGRAGSIYLRAASLAAMASGALIMARPASCLQASGGCAKSSVLGGCNECADLQAAMSGQHSTKAPERICSSLLLSRSCLTPGCNHAVLT